jgi:tetratricopeptide (TPR) repeat protein
MENAGKRFPVLWGLWFVKFTRGDYPDAISRAEELLGAAQDGRDGGHLLEARHSLWATLCAMGRSADALPHMEHGLALYDRDKHGALAFEFAGHDAGACCHWHLASTQWVLGYPDRARREATEAVRLARELQHPMTNVIALWFAAWVAFQRGEHDAAALSAQQSLEIAEAHRMQRWGDSAILLARTKHRDKSFEELKRMIESTSATAWRRTFSLCMLAEISADSGELEFARRLLAGLSSSDRHGFFAANLVRTEGDILLKCDQSAVADAEALFQRSLKISRSRNERSLELRAATSLARLWQKQGRREEARSVLTGIYGWFTEGFDTADLRAAKHLLNELGGTAPAAR